MKTTLSPAQAGNPKACVDAAVRREAERTACIKRYYGERGNPLLAWLADEARRRGDSPEEMACALGTTVKYILQMERGKKKTSAMTDEFARACANYLGVQVVAVKLVTNRSPLSSFLRPGDGEAAEVTKVFEG